MGAYSFCISSSCRHLVAVAGMLCVSLSTVGPQHLPVQPNRHKPYPHRLSTPATAAVTEAAAADPGHDPGGEPQALCQADEVSKPPCARCLFFLPRVYRSAVLRMSPKAASARAADLAIGAAASGRSPGYDGMLLTRLTRPVTGIMKRSCTRQVGIVALRHATA